MGGGQRCTGSTDAIRAETDDNEAWLARHKEEHKEKKKRQLEK